MEVALFGFLVWDFRGWIAWFVVGACTHWFADALTIQGVPLGWWSDRRVHLFGGRVRTGSGGEFVIAAACVAIAAMVVRCRSSRSMEGSISEYDHCDRKQPLFLMGRET